MIIRYSAIVVFILCSSAVFSAEKTPDPRKIMQRVLDRDDGGSLAGKVRFSTCRYVKKGKTLACAEQPREKIMQQFSKDTGKNKKDTNGLTIILEPAAERGIGFLQYDYEDDSKESDQWVYLSAMGKVKRIAGGDKDQPKSGSFFGSEISFEDIEKRKLNNYTYRLLQSETYRGRPCWVIETVPVDEFRPRTSYSKTWVWIDKTRYLTLKRILFDKKGKKLKRMAFKNPEKIDDVWVIKKIEVNNLVTRRITLVSTLAIKINVDIDDSYFTLRSLTDQSFRERLMRQFSQVVR